MMSDERQRDPRWGGGLRLLGACSAGLGRARPTALGSSRILPADGCPSPSRDSAWTRAEGPSPLLVVLVLIKGAQAAKTARSVGQPGSLAAATASSSPITHRRRSLHPPAPGRPRRPGRRAGAAIAAVRCARASVSKLTCCEAPRSALSGRSSPDGLDAVGLCPAVVDIAHAVQSYKRCAHAREAAGQNGSRQPAHGAGRQSRRRQHVQDYGCLANVPSTGRSVVPRRPGGR